MLIGLLALGFVLGLRHALDADHIAAVASLAARKASLRDTLRVSGAWGVGHAATLVVFGGVLVLVGANLPESVAVALEGCVGVMLVILGASVLLRLRRRRIHFHVHAHGPSPASGEARHVHLHSHARDGHPHGQHDHQHQHGRALLIGCVHGLAGTAGLVLVAVPAMKSGLAALAYLAVFGLGTVVGMMLFSLAIAVPLQFSARRLRRTTVALQIVLGLTNLALGLWIATDSTLIFIFSK